MTFDYQAARLTMVESQVRTSDVTDLCVQDAMRLAPREAAALALLFAGRAATPEWSPRGDQIAFTHIVGDFRIAVMTPDGRNVRDLTNSWQDEAPTWAPNGRIIQFFRTEKNSGKTSIWQVDLTGRNERQLPTPGDASDPAWGPIEP